jgi:hypothetical protein
VKRRGPPKKRGRGSHRRGPICKTPFVSASKYPESPCKANWRSVLDPSLPVPEHLAGPINNVRLAWNCLATPELHDAGKNALLQPKRAILSSRLPQEEMRRRWRECLPGRIRTLQRTEAALPRLAARLGLESLDHIAAQLRTIRECYEQEVSG